MARRRRLKKGGGDLEVHKQNVISSEDTINEQNVSPSTLGAKCCSIKIEN
jgi:hypothetical protein